MDRLVVKPTDDWRTISEDLWGVFFEDISYSADGGLSAEMVRNGSFSFTRADSEHWNGFTAWQKIIPEQSHGAFCLSDRDALAIENPVHAVVEVQTAPIALSNEGFDGMRIRADVDYRCSLWAWLRSDELSSMRIRVTLQDDDNQTLASEIVTVDALTNPNESVAVGMSPNWRQFHIMLHPQADATHGRLKLEFLDRGIIEIDFVSLEPEAPWHGNELLRHLRADIVDALAELHPRFMRFPGGCITHGYGLSNMYHWKHTVGPVEHRRQQFNCWGYHQSFRLGYFEYLCLCEAIGAKPLPIVAAGVCCQNSDSGATAIPHMQMDEYVQDILDLIEFCNGGVDTPWGAVRAKLGHEKPFGLEMIGIGNEDRIDDAFTDRFKQIYRAIHERYPQINVVGTVGPALFGRDYDEGWALARQLNLPLVDEHSYQSPAWWFQHLNQYDNLSRSGPKVYLGEYGSWGSTLFNALSEAALMVSMERNGDAVAMASYAPLLCKKGHASWNPNLIYFDNDRVYDTYNYWVQWMFASSAARRVLPVTVEGAVEYRRDLPTQSRLQCVGVDGQWFGDVRVETLDGPVFVGRDIQCDASRSGWADCGMNWNSDSYVISLTTRLSQLPSAFRIAFGDVDDIGFGTSCCTDNDPASRDHTEIVFNVSPSRVRYETLMIRDGFNTSYSEPVLIDTPLSVGQKMIIRVRVEQRGQIVGVSVNGEPESVSVEPGVEIRRSVGVAHDDTRGLTLVRVVNAMNDSVEVDCSHVLGKQIARDGVLHDVMCTVLSGDPRSGISGESVPERPERRHCELVNSCFICPAWSFTVLEIPDVDA